MIVQIIVMCFEIYVHIQYIHTSKMKIICIYTNTTAQGGGGSFKNIKPIRGVVCCESWLAAQTH